MSYPCSRCGKFSFPKPAICFWCATKGSPPPGPGETRKVTQEEAEQAIRAAKKRKKARKELKDRDDSNTEMF